LFLDHTVPDMDELQVMGRKIKITARGKIFNISPTTHPYQTIILSLERSTTAISLQTIYLFLPTWITVVESLDVPNGSPVVVELETREPIAPKEINMKMETDGTH
jgi:hypothetical protein